MIKDELRNRLNLKVAERFELHAAIIRSARDPFAMIEIMRPLISHPAVHNGHVPPLYYELAAQVLSDRRASQTVTSH